MPSLITVPAPDYGYSLESDWANRVEMGASAIIKTRSLRTRPVYTLSMAWAMRTPSTLASFLDSLHALRESYTQVCIWTPSVLEDRWTLCPVGTGDGSKLEFVFGAKNMQSGTITVYVDGTPDTNYTAAAKGGDAAGRWAITFTAGHAPANGKAVTCSYNGQRLLSGWFTSARNRSVPSYGVTAFQATFRGTEVETIA